MYLAFVLDVFETACFVTLAEDLTCRPDKAAKYQSKYFKSNKLAYACNQTTYELLLLRASVDLALLALGSLQSTAAQGSSTWLQQYVTYPPIWLHLSNIPLQDVRRPVHLLQISCLHWLLNNM